MKGYTGLALLAALLAFFVITLGAYVRLSDAGLGCPDWPGCYGHLTPHHASEQIAVEEAANPHGPVTSAKAWKEMTHRYAASTLGLLIILLTVLAWRRHLADRTGEPRPLLESLLLVLVVFQGLLGMWTVTWLLKPVIVSAHLMGGMALFALLCWLALRVSLNRSGQGVTGGLRWLLLIALIALIVQIFLGAWVSSNYAALACPDFPTCHGRWWPDMDPGQAFVWHRELGQTASGELLPLTALNAIHFVHRLGALLVTLLVGAAGIGLFASGRYLAGGGVLGLLLLQISLGIANVLASLPLPVAVAHNGTAALLLAALVCLNLVAYDRQRTSLFTR